MSKTTKKRKRTSRNRRTSRQRGGRSFINLDRYKSALEELSDFCGSDLLSEESLRDFFGKNKDLTCINNDVVIADNNIEEGYSFFFRACFNENIDVEILSCLLKYFPNAAKDSDTILFTPLHYACDNENVTLEIVQLLLDAAPESVYFTTEDGSTTIHKLCSNEDVDEATAVDILKELLSEYPEAASMADADGYTPLHCAFRNKNVTIEFATLLLDAAPESFRHTTSQKGLTPLHLLCFDNDIDETIAIKILKKYPRANLLESARQSDSCGYLPLHHACICKTKEFCSLLVDAYPNAVNQRSNEGYYPIQYVLGGGNDAVEVVKYLLAYDPRVRLQKMGEFSLLVGFCHWCYDEPDVEAGVQIINAIYAAHPDAIYDVVSLYSRTRFMMREEVRTFIEREEEFVRQAKDFDFRRLMTPDENGQLPLHRALANNAALGSIKLLVKGSPTALNCADNNGALSLHVACQHHNSPCVAQYLIDLRPASIRSMDNDGNTVLHLACRGAKYDTITMLLEKHDALSLSKRNNEGKLPIDLLFESSEVDDRENAEYVGIVFRLLVAYPVSFRLV